MRRFAAGTLLALVATTGLAGCGDRDEARDDLLAAIRRTEQLSYRFVYDDKRPARSLPEETQPLALSVQGIIQDDFRFKARVAYNDVPAWDEVVNDDVLAVRFVEPGRISELVNKEAVARADTSTDLQGVSSLQALQSRRWVVDKTAAPAVAIGRVRESELGKDPVLDAVTALTYVEEAVRQAEVVVKFNPDSVQPTYSSSEDTFPKPEDGSGVTRYDLRRPKLPPPGQSTPGTPNSAPTTKNFRRMAIYVKGGRVIQVREEINVRGKFTEDVSKYLETFAKEGGASEGDIDQMKELFRETPSRVLGDRLLEYLNLALTQFGEEPILTRSMRLDLRDLGEPATIDLPTSDVVNGGLGYLIVSEKGKAEEQDAGSNTGPAQATTTTTAAPPGP